MIYHGSHKNMYKYGNEHKESTNHNRKIVNGVRQYRLRLWAFVSVGEAFLFIFKASNVNHKNSKWITICILLYLKNPTQLTALKTDERSSRKRPAKLISPMASLHKNGFGFTILQHLSSSKHVPQVSKKL
jgi:hypothetical protein